MDLHGTSGGSNVPAFLAKLWTLVEDPETDALICWNPEGNSFHVFDQGQFAKDVLPKYFKHNNMASFVRQLNMYGFRKVVHIEQGGLVKPERDDTEFQHPFFIRGQEQLLENIKRKVNTFSGTKNEEVKGRQDNVGKLLTDVQFIKGKQENMDCRLLAMKHENEALWREVASLRQKHSQQQKVVSKLIQFLISLVQSNRILGVKRKIPLMLNDSTTAHPLPKYSRQYSLEHVHGASSYPGSISGFTSDSSLYTQDPSAGPIISDVTELADPSPPVSPCPSLDDSCSAVILIKDEPLTPSHSPADSQQSPEVEDSPLSPSTFIDSILQESEPSDDHSLHSLPQTCLSVACLDRLELNDHVDNIDSGLDNLQNMLSSSTLSMDASALMDIFSPTLGLSDFSLPDLDSSLASIQELLSPPDQRTSETEMKTPDRGKQIVHYTAQPLILMDSNGSDLPILLELEGDDHYITEEGDDCSGDPTLALLSLDSQNRPAGSSISEISLN